MGVGLFVCLLHFIETLQTTKEITESRQLIGRNREGNFLHSCQVNSNMEPLLYFISEKKKNSDIENITD